MTMGVSSGGRNKAKTKKGMTMDKNEKVGGIKLLRDPFPDHHISKLPKPTKAQTEQVKADYKAGIRCKICGGWHHKDVVHLDYVGHAALTDRLLDADVAWSWEPLATGADGYPVIDRDGGMWIKLTVCGVTRLGYGDAQGKTGGDAMKERIGDALRNAAMRFGAALDLWHKGTLHRDECAEPEKPEKEPQLPAYPDENIKANIARWESNIRAGKPADSIIKAISERYTLTDEQKAAIRALGEQNGAV